MPINRFKFFIIFCLFCFVGCQMFAHKVTEESSFQPVIIKGPYTPRTDHVVFILDASLSMAKDRFGNDHLNHAKEILQRINLTIPKMKLDSALRTFGYAKRPTDFRSDLIYGPAAHNKIGLNQAINGIKFSGGMSALHLAIQGVITDYKDASGHLSVIVITDGDVNNEKSLSAISDLKTHFGQRVSFYPIVVNDKNRLLMEKFVKQAGQGFVEIADNVYSPENVATYVNKVFLSRIRVSDQDGDGIVDNKDMCPDTPAGARVTINGCWILGKIQFASNSSSLSAEMYPYLDEVVAILKNNPDLRMEVQGHTDSTGSADHNFHLSKNRAKSVMQYFIQKGVASDRLRYTGYGETKPISTNKTEKGKALNRRVELSPIKH